MEISNCWFNSGHSEGRTRMDGYPMNRMHRADTLTAVKLMHAQCFIPIR